MKQNDQKQVVRFLFVGVTTVAVDYVTYLYLLNISSANTAKTFSFIAGAAFSYLTNRAWTFSSKKKHSKAILTFGTLYLSTLVINVGLNSTALTILESFDQKILMAFVIATGASAVLNFIGMKYFIFKIEEEVGQ